VATTSIWLPLPSLRTGERANPLLEERLLIKRNTIERKHGAGLITNDRAVKPSRLLIRFVGARSFLYARGNPSSFD
jgi:hypothetical protein